METWMFAMLAIAVVKRLLSIVIRPRAAGGRPPIGRRADIQWIRPQKTSPVVGSR